MANTAERPSVLWDLLAGACIVLGAWTVAMPYALQFWLYEGVRINDVVCGFLIVGWAITELVLSPTYRWSGLANVVLGLWLAVSPFVFGATASGAAVFGNIATGLIVAVLALGSVAGGWRNNHAATGRA